MLPDFNNLAPQLRGLLIKFHCCVSAVPPAAAQTCVSPEKPVTVLKTRLFQTGPFGTCIDFHSFISIQP